MSVGKLSYFAASWCTFNKTLFDEIRFVNFLNCAGILAECGGNGVEPYRTAIEFCDNGGENLIVDFIKSVAVNVESFKSEACYSGSMMPLPLT